ncbi:MAG: hypothetical protein EZS28_040328, partial [Streblomastix strix]
MLKRITNKVVVEAGVVAVAVSITANKYKKIGQGREIRQLHEQMEMRTGWRMMNAADKWRKRDKSNSIENNKLRTTNNHNRSNYKCKSPQHNTPHKSLSPYLQQYSPSP